MDKQNKKAPQKKESSNLSRNILIVVILVIIAYVVYEFAIKKPEVVVPPVVERQMDKVTEPQFKKEGDLTFLKKDGKTEIQKIDIEIADNSDERMQGMMYRKSNEENRGMLFIFQQEGEQEFWMKNTIISLDIMFVDKDKNIVSIFKNTTPFSEKGLPSGSPAMYVVEVNGGYADKYGVEVGDKIQFTYN